MQFSGLFSGLFEDHRSPRRYGLAWDLLQAKDHQGDRHPQGFEPEKVEQSKTAGLC